MIESPHSFVQVAVVSPFPQFPSSLGVLLVLHSAPEQQKYTLVSSDLTISDRVWKRPYKEQLFERLRTQL